MSHRDRLIALTVVVALLWLFATALQPTSGPAVMFWVGDGVILLTPLVGLIAYALAALIGALSRRWQSAVALNLLAGLPALALVALTTVRLSFGLPTLDIMAPLAALGWLGWLLRSLRVEFSG